MFKILGSVVSNYERVSMTSSYFFPMWEFQDVFSSKQEAPH